MNLFPMATSQKILQGPSMIIMLNVKMNAMMNYPLSSTVKT